MPDPKTLYVPRLARGKWYVGTTGQSPRQRLATHERGAGSAWTRAHPVEAMVHTEDVPAATAGILETAKTLELMGRHGVGNVRGGSYCQRVLTLAQTEDVERQLRHNDGSCLRCAHPQRWRRHRRGRDRVRDGERERERRRHVRPMWTTRALRIKLLRAHTGGRPETLRALQNEKK